jgi:hypothetical protein
MNVLRLLKGEVVLQKFEVDERQATAIEMGRQRFSSATAYL